MPSSSLSSSSLAAYFDTFNAWFDEDAQRSAAIRAHVQQLHAIERVMHVQLQRVHGVDVLLSSDADATVSDRDRVRELARSEALRDAFAQVAGVCAAIRRVVSPRQWLQYTGMWRDVAQTLVFHLCFSHWLSERDLPTLERVCKSFDGDDVGAGATSSTSPAAWSESDMRAFPFIDIEEYLHGVTLLPREMSRMCLNAVRAGNFALPQEIGTFVSDLYASLRLLNLRNDSLRRKFDSIKYELEKIENVLYDLRVHQPVHVQNNVQNNAQNDAQNNAQHEPKPV